MLAPVRVREDTELGHGRGGEVATTTATTTTALLRNDSPVTVKRALGNSDSTTVTAERNVQVKKIGGKYRLTDATKAATSSLTQAPRTGLDDESALSRKKPISNSRSTFLGTDSDSDDSQKDKVCMYVCIAFVYRIHE